MFKFVMFNNTAMLLASRHDYHSFFQLIVSLGDCNKRRENSTLFKVQSAAEG